MKLPVFLFKRDGIIPGEDFGQNDDYGKPVQAPNVRFHANDQNRNCRSFKRAIGCFSCPMD